VQTLTQVTSRNDGAAEALVSADLRTAMATRCD
jgi:hypothetical protein